MSREALSTVLRKYALTSAICLVCHFIKLYRGLVDDVGTVSIHAAALYVRRHFHLNIYTLAADKQYSLLHGHAMSGEKVE